MCGGWHPNRDLDHTVILDDKTFFLKTNKCNRMYRLQPSSPFGATKNLKCEPERKKGELKDIYKG